MPPGVAGRPMGIDPLHETDHRRGLWVGCD